MSTSHGPTSPCIGVCELDQQGICAGCLRSREEITQWFTASDELKREILKSVSGRQPLCESSPIKTSI